MLLRLGILKNILFLSATKSKLKLKWCGGKQARHASLKLLLYPLQLLLASDSPIMAVTTSGSTAMSAAAEAGRDEIVRILMEKAQSDVKLEEICSIKVSH